jgi:hypothetical protein
VRAAHDGYLGADVEGVDVVGAVGLAEHAVDVIGERVELEPEVEVDEAVVVGDAVVVCARLFLGDGHGVGHDAERAPELHHDGVRLGRPRDGQRRRGGRGPARAVDARQDDALVVEGDVEVVGGGVPLGGRGGAEVEGVVVLRSGEEEDAEGLDPGEVALQLRVVVADEVGVDVEVPVGDDAEVLVSLAVEVEVVAVAAGEARVAARRAGLKVAYCERKLINHICSILFILRSIENNEATYSRRSCRLGRARGTWLGSGWGRWPCTRAAASSCRRT